VTQRYTDLPVDWCAQERQDIAIDWFFGGYGALFSRGLLESISMDEWDDCVRSYDYKKGDAIVAFCLQKLGDVLPSFPESLVVEMASNYAQGTVPNASKTLSRQDIPECISSHGKPLACHLKRWTQEHSIYWRGVYAIWNQLSHYWLSQ